MDIKKLLFVTRFETLCFDALKSLLVLRAASLNHVVFVNVIEREKVGLRRGVGYLKSEEVRLREMANIRFIDWAEDLFEQGMEVGVYIVVGNPVVEMIKAAQKEEADLIVIGRSEKGTMEKLYSGSTVTELIRLSRVPVLVFKHLSDTKHVLERPFERVLVAVDWSPACLRAVGYLKRLKGIVQKVDLVHVVSEKDLEGQTGMDIQRTRKETRRRLDEIGEMLEAEGIAVEGHLHVGRRMEEIERAARENESTLIVMGSSTKSAWVERWIGSLPRAIAEQSPFPTLLIPPEVRPDVDSP